METPEVRGRDADATSNGPSKAVRPGGMRSVRKGQIQGGVKSRVEMEMPPGADGACSDARATTSAARSGVPPEGMCQNAKAADPDADCDAKSEAFKTPTAGDVEGRETAGDAEGREAAHRPRLSSAPQEDAATVKEEDDGELRSSTPQKRWA